tara:strand:- start:1541 stop:4198 length:2658 start_codon:yes stop_codon:yes gene_type:complete
MARTKLPAYTSVYKDPGSVAINTELRRRYASSFQNDDALTGAVDGMVNAQFEGDQMLKDDLSSRYNNNLRERSRRGDYETMGQTITRDSRQFVKEYSPIKQNYETVQAYQLRLQEAYKEGKIDEETYRRSFAMSAHGYKGLQQNEDGSINDQSFFSGYNFVDDQNISKLMDDAMQGYAAHEGGSDIQRVGQGPDAMYKMRVGNKWEIVPQSDVETMFNDVVSDPSVRAYLNQKADLRTFDISDEELQKQLSLNLYGDPDNVEDKGLYGMINDLVSQGKDEEAEAYKKIVEQQESLLHGSGVESPEELINMRKKAAHKQVVDSELGRERNAALTKYVRDNRWVTSIQEYDDVWKIGYQKKVDDYIADYTEDTPLIEMAYEGGNTYEQITAHIDLQKGEQDRQVAGMNDLLKEHNYTGEALTADQILSGDYTSLTIGDQPVTDFIDIKMLNLIQDKLRVHTNAQNRSLNILKAAEDQFGEELATTDEIFRNTKFQIGSGAGNQSTTYGKIIEQMNYVTNGSYQQSSTVMSNIKEMFSSKHGNDYIELGDGKIRVQYGYDSNGKLLNLGTDWKTEGMVLNLNDIGSLDYLNIMKQASKQTNSNWRGWTINGSRLANKLMYHVFKEHDKKHNTRIYDGVLFNDAPDPQNVFDQAGKRFTNYKAATSNYYDKRDAYITEASKQYIGGQASEVIPGMNSDEAQKNTKIVNKALDGRVLNDHFEIYYDNKKQEGTGTIQSFKEQYGITGDVTVKDIKFVTSPMLGEAVLQLQIQGKSGGVSKTETVFFPTKQIKNTGLSEYINSPSFKIEMDVNAARQSPVETTTIQFKKGSDDIGTTLTWDFNKDNSKNTETVLVQTADGGVQEFAVGDPIIAFMIQEAVSNGYNFWTVKE